MKSLWESLESVDSVDSFRPVDGDSVRGKGPSSGGGLGAGAGGC